MGVDNGNDDVIILRNYKRLPDFCYKCGIIGNSFRDCCMMPGNPKLDFGAWLRAQPPGKIKISLSRRPNSILHKSSADSQVVYQDSELSKEKQASLQVEKLPNRVEAITYQNSSGDVSNIIPNNTLVNPQSLKRFEEDCTLREVDGMQGKKNSMKWKRRAREHAGKKATYTPIVKVKLGHKREAVANLEESSSELKRLEKNHVSDDMEFFLNLLLSAEIAMQSRRQL